MKNHIYKMRSKDKMSGQKKEERATKTPEQNSKNNPALISLLLGEEGIPITSQY